MNKNVYSLPMYVCTRSFHGWTLSHDRRQMKQIQSYDNLVLRSLVDETCSTLCFLSGNLKLEKLRTRSSGGKSSVLLNSRVKELLDPQPTVFFLLRSKIRTPG